VPLRSGERSAQIRYWSGATASLCAADSNRARWANGVSLLSTQVGHARAGQAATVQLCLRIDQVPAAGSDYHWTNQLFDAGGKRWAQIDSPGYPARYWRAADVIVQQFSLDLPADLPAGTYTLRLGQYTYPDVATIAVLDAAGNPQSDAVEIPIAVSR
jgi:hypothetical protein